MKSLTPFGKEVRKYRIDRGETQMEVAGALGISVAFLSALETGKKNVPDQILEEIVHHFELDMEQATSLKKAAWISRKETKINMSKLNAQNRELVVGFARSFEDGGLDEERAKKIREILGLEEK